MKWYTILGMAFFGFAFLFAWHAYPSFDRNNSLTSNLATPSTVEVADMSIEGMHFIEQSNAGPTWQLLAHSASFYDHKHLVLLHKVRAHLASDTPHTVYIEADYGQLDSLTGNMSVQGGVHLQYLDDYTIRTEALSWHAAGRIVQTENTVQIVSAFVHIAGRGLYGEANQHNFVLRDDVHASFTLQ